MVDYRRTISSTDTIFFSGTKVRDIYTDGFGVARSHVDTLPKFHEKLLKKEEEIEKLTPRKKGRIKGRMNYVI